MSETVKIPIKPIKSGDVVSKARDMSGLRKWARESHAFGRMLSILGWFTIPAEVFLRYRFGRRWFTPMNFYAGALLICAFFALQYVFDYVCYWLTTLESTFNPFYSKDAVGNFAASVDLFYLLSLYAALGVIRLFYIWFRNKTKDDIHSYDDGISWLEHVAEPVIWLINGIAWIIVDIIGDPLNSDSKKDMPHPKLVTDKTAFTNMILEPLFFFWFAYDYPFLLGKCLFYIMGFAVAIHASRREMAKEGKILDFKDSAIEAKAMRELHKSMQQNKMEEKKATKGKKNAPPLVPKVPIHYPDLATIIDWVHLEKHPIKI
ncbi:MAG: hypothetical protein J0L80_02440 [Chitinophagales bacterium]|nr:hypothetical protein [Chitinophagales bacterium]